MPIITGHRTGLVPRLTAAVAVGFVCGGVFFAAQHVMPSPVPSTQTDCSDSDVVSGFGCLIGGLLADLFINAILWLAGIVLVSLVTGAVLGWLVDRWFGVWIGILPILLWIPILWVLPDVLAPVGITVELSSPVVIGYTAAVILLIAAINWPRIPFPARLCANGSLITIALLALWVG